MPQHNPRDDPGVGDLIYYRDDADGAIKTVVVTKVDGDTITYHKDGRLETTTLSMWRRKARTWWLH